MADHSPRQLILSLFGLYARDEANWLSVRSLIELMRDLDVDASATRSSVSRLKKRGVLEPAKTKGQAGYRLSASALAVLREGDARIWSRPRASVGDGWLMVVFSVPEAERGKRHELRSLLTRLGFGTAAPGVWIAPAHLYEATAETLRRLELDAYADLFHGEHLAFADVAEKVRRW
ncbi:MAG: PaaX family transcriptional regulator, partial [Nocardioides sp.]